MLGRKRNTPAPLVAPNYYDARNSAAESVYNADLVPPATSYAATRSALHSTYVNPTVAPKTRAAFVDHHWRMNGLKFNWSWGGINMQPFTKASLPGQSGGLNGFVQSTDFQTTLVQLHDWQTNDNWYNCWNGSGSGMFNGSKETRYTYPSFRVSQINTSVTGGPGQYTQRMQPSPRFTSVQTIQRYSAQPSYYNTRSTNS